MDEKEVMEIIGQVMHPEIDASLMELGMIKDIKLEGNKVSLTMVFPFPGVPIREMLMESVRKPLEEQGLQVEINEAVMNQEELQNFFKMEQEKWKGM